MIMMKEKEIWRWEMIVMEKKRRRRLKRWS